jgi:hypothetical protein
MQLQFLPNSIESQIYEHTGALQKSYSSFKEKESRVMTDVEKEWLQLLDRK